MFVSEILFMQVMQELGLIGLRIQRMPSEPDLEFGIPSQYSYMTVRFWCQIACFIFQFLLYYFIYYINPCNGEKNHHENLIV